MCGIFGAAFHSAIQPQDLPQLRAGTKSLSHRGPDHGDEAIWDRVYFGHRRLSIIDLSPAANQPLHSPSSPVSIIFNGEIYNFRDLVSQMPGFFSVSDTETLLEGYLRKGESFFQSLRGIYAFAIFDRRKQPKLILGRDPCGVKSLYFHQSERVCAFGSEIKALLPLLKPSLSLNERILKAYLHLGYCPEPATIYNEIECVPPGQFLTIELPNLKVTSKTFLTFDFEQKNHQSLQEILEGTSHHLANAVSRNMVADVPISLSLSGGIDSSLIFAFANRSKDKHPGLTVRFSDRDHDESPVARAFADHLGSPIEIIDAETDGRLEVLNKVFLHFDQPYADSSALPFYFLAKAARSRSKVLIGGDGGDEIHDGYPGFGLLPLLWKWFKPPFWSSVGATILDQGGNWIPGSKGRVARRLAGILKKSHPLDRMFEWTAWFPTHFQSQKESPFLFDSQDSLEFCRMTLAFSEEDAPDVPVRRFYFQQRMLGDFLRKTDMMSMIHGLEYRVPMLDEDLVQHALQIPHRKKAGFRQQKKVLRELHSRIYPKSLSSRPKTGFTIPLDRWLGENNLARMKEVMLQKESFAQSFIRKSYIEELFNPREMAKGRISRAARYQRLLMIYNLENWYREIYAKR